MLAAPPQRHAFLKPCDVDWAHANHAVSLDPAHGGGLWLVQPPDWRFHGTSDVAVATALVDGTRGLTGGPGEVARTGPLRNGDYYFERVRQFLALDRHPKLVFTTVDLYKRLKSDGALIQTRTAYLVTDNIARVFMLASGFSTAIEWLKIVRQTGLTSPEPRAATVPGETSTAVYHVKLWLAHIAESVF